MTRAVLASATLAVLALQAAEGPATPASTVRSGPQPIQYAGADLKQVAAVRFYASNNGGGAWTRIGEVAVDAASPATPRIEFRAPSDGTWHFVTAASLRDGRKEPEPQAGKLPVNALSVVIDNTPPEIQDVQATVDQVGEGTATTGITWRVADANFAGITVEVSGDGGRTFVAAPGTTPSGYLKLTVARTPGVPALLVKVGARDLAGNVAVAQPRSLPLPLPADPEQALAQAVARLPDPAEIAQVGGEPESAAAPQAQPGITAAPAMPADEPAAQAPAAAAAPEAGEDPFLEPTASPAARAKGDAAAKPGHVSYPSGATAAPAGPAAIPAGGFLVGAAASDLLEDARGLAAQGERAAAAERYRRLLDSDQAVAAASEGMALLWRSGDAAGAAAIGDGLAIELQSDEVRVEHGRALLALGRHADALRAVAPISTDSPVAREALLVVADVRAAQGRGEQAQRIYSHLANDEDAVAREARARLRR